MGVFRKLCRCISQVCTLLLSFQLVQYVLVIRNTWSVNHLHEGPANDCTNLSFYHKGRWRHSPTLHKHVWCTVAIHIFSVASLLVVVVVFLSDYKLLLYSYKDFIHCSHCCMVYVCLHIWQRTAQGIVLREHNSGSSVPICSFMVTIMCALGPANAY